MLLERTLSRASKDQRISALGAFMWQCLRNPFRIGAVAPSSRALAMAMAGQVLRRHSGTIVEFGPGTGAITAALLDLGIARERLYLVE
jgi:phosphatidylethanolamine/phosphatidyl-N-methylethanolamine N-methyltransferase